MLFASLTSKNLSRRLGESPVSLSPLILGEDFVEKFRLSQEVGGTEFEIDREIVEVKLALGFKDSRPTGGNFALRIGPAPISASNSSNSIAYDFSADGAPAAFEAAINAATITDGATIGKAENTFYQDGSLIFEMTGTDPEIEFGVADNCLSPRCAIRVTNYELGSKRRYEVRLTQLPAAVETDFAIVVPDAPEIVVVQDGAEDVDGVPIREIQELVFNPEFRGSLALGKGSRSTGAFLQSITPAALQTLLNETLVETGSGQVFAVAIGRNNVARITFDGEFAGIDQDPLTVTVVSAPPGDIQIKLDLDKAPAHAFLRAGEVERVPLELFVKYKDEQDDAVTHRAKFQTEVTFTTELITDDVEVLDPINYALPWLPRDYVPRTDSQVRTGVQYWSVAFPDSGAVGNTTFAMSHGLQTDELASILVRENQSSGRVLINGTDYVATIVDINRVDIEILTGGTPTLEEYEIIIAGSEPVSQWDPDLEISMAQVTGLLAYFADILARLTALEDRLGVNPGPRLTSGAADGPSASVTFRNVFEAYPSRVALEESTARIVDLDLSDLGRARGLLPAVHTGTIESLKASLPAASAEYVGTVFRNDWQEFDVVSGEGHRFGKSARGEFLACDGRLWYPVKKYGRHASGVVATVDVTGGDTTTVDAIQNEYSNGTRVLWTTTGTLPAPLNAQVEYFVINRTKDSIELSATSGGTAITLTTAGTGTHTIYKAQNTSFYPSIFERELFRFAINGDQLRDGTTLRTRFAVELATKNANVNANWTIALEVGENVPDVTPSTTGRNLGPVVWRGTPLLSRSVTLTPDPFIHRLGFELDRDLIDSIDTLTARGLRYGATDSEIVPPNSPDAIFRLRLIEFDTENNEPDPEGFVIVRGLRFDAPGVHPLEGFAEIS